jgi:hypothetical protein
LAFFQLNNLASPFPAAVFPNPARPKLFHKMLKNKEFAVVNSNNFHQLCAH